MVEDLTEVLLNNDFETPMVFLWRGEFCLKANKYALQPSFSMVATVYVCTICIKQTNLLYPVHHEPMNNYRPSNKPSVMGIFVEHFFYFFYFAIF